MMLVHHTRKFIEAPGVEINYTIFLQELRARADELKCRVPRRARDISGLSLDGESLKTNLLHSAEALSVSTGKSMGLCSVVELAYLCAYHLHHDTTTDAGPAAR